ncbi:MAG: hypothetical protein HY606_10730 [Planctomycetes bacterium]|nr:hypothetical protein [Planctomycetota bacterium]
MVKKLIPLIILGFIVATVLFIKLTFFNDPATPTRKIKIAPEKKQGKIISKSEQQQENINPIQKEAISKIENSPQHNCNNTEKKILRDESHKNSDNQSIGSLTKTAKYSDVNNSDQKSKKHKEDDLETGESSASSEKEFTELFSKQLEKLTEFFSKIDLEQLKNPDLYEKFLQEIDYKYILNGIDNASAATGLPRDAAFLYPFLQHNMFNGNLTKDEFEGFPKEIFGNGDKLSVAEIGTTTALKHQLLTYDTIEEYLTKFTTNKKIPASVLNFYKKVPPVIEYEHSGSPVRFYLQNQFKLSENDTEKIKSHVSSLETKLKSSAIRRDKILAGIEFVTQVSGLIGEEKAKLLKDDTNFINILERLNY